MQQSIDIMKNHITEILSDNKPSLYLFGSVVLDDFKLGWSDIDFLCLTRAPISENQANELVDLRQRLWRNIRVTCTSDPSKEDFYPFRNY